MYRQSTNKVSGRNPHQIPTDLLQVIELLDFSPVELRVLDYIARRTGGFREASFTTDKYQLARSIGHSAQQVEAVVWHLERNNVLIVEGDMSRRNPFRLGLEKRWEVWRGPFDVPQTTHAQLRAVETTTVSCPHCRITRESNCTHVDASPASEVSAVTEPKPAHVSTGEAVESGSEEPEVAWRAVIVPELLVKHLGQARFSGRQTAVLMVALLDGGIVPSFKALEHRTGIRSDKARNATYELAEWNVLTSMSGRFQVNLDSSTWRLPQKG